MKTTIAHICDTDIYSLIGVLLAAALSSATKVASEIHIQNNRRTSASLNHNGENMLSFVVVDANAVASF